MVSVTATPTTANILLDPQLAGRTISLDVERFTGHAIRAEEGLYVRRCRLDQSHRQGLRRDSAGNVILSPIARAADRLVGAMHSQETGRVRRAAIDFYETRCEEMHKQLDKIVRLRSAHSAMLVGVGSYTDGAFTGSSYLDGQLSELRPWQIGLSGNVMKKLGLACEDLAILSRYPTTRVVPVEVIEQGDSDGVVHLPVGKVQICGQETSLTDLLDGDRDGDSYTVRTVKSQTARDELKQVFQSFWHGAERVPVDRTVHGWQDHEEAFDDAWEVAEQKILQKSAIGGVTLDWYAAFVFLAKLETDGVETGLTFEDIRQMMTDSLEAVFDLKHHNSADPMALHSLLLGMKSFQEVRDALEAQGLDVVKLEKLARLLQGRSVRELAAGNPAFAVCLGSDSSAIRAFVSSVPEYKPLVFLTALIVAQKLKTALSVDLVFYSGRSAKPLAVQYASRLFPLSEAKGGGAAVQTEANIQEVRCDWRKAGSMGRTGIQT